MSRRLQYENYWNRGAFLVDNGSSRGFQASNASVKKTNRPKQVGAVLGRGNCGEVWQARHKETGTLIALKVSVLKTRSDADLFRLYGFAVFRRLRS